MNTTSSLLRRYSACRTLGVIFCALLLLGHIRVSAAPQFQPQTQALQTIPLAAHESGQAMMQQAVSQMKLDLYFKFLNKNYEADQYARDPITGKKIRISCVRFKADGGFEFKIDPPQYSLTSQQLTVSQNISKIRYDGISAKFQFGPCAWTGVGIGVQLTDVKFVYKARPMLSFGSNGACQLVWNNDPNSLSVSIGDLNIIGVQNDIDKLAKDAAREALNFTLDAALGSGLRGELRKVVLSTCGGGNPKKPR